MFQANFDHFKIESKDKSSVEPSKLSCIEIEIEVEIEFEIQSDLKWIESELNWIVRIGLNRIELELPDWIDKMIELKSYLA